MRLLQRALYEQLRAEAVATRERLAAVVRPLTPLQLDAHPEPTGWSVGQVLEHLCVADELYEPLLATVLRLSRPDAGAVDRDWKSSFIGGQIATALLNPKPLKGPKAFQPGPTPRKNVVDKFFVRETNFVRAMNDAAAYDWRALRVRSPALPRWAPKMNLGDGFRIHIVHLTRHSHQIERLVRQL